MVKEVRHSKTELQVGTVYYFDEARDGYGYFAGTDGFSYKFKPIDPGLAFVQECGHVIMWDVKISPEEPEYRWLVKQD